MPSRVTKHIILLVCRCTLVAQNHWSVRLHHCYVPSRKWYIYWNDIRRYHCITLDKIICIIFIHLSETGRFIGMRICFPLYTTGDSPLYWEILTFTLGFFISFCLVSNIFSVQLWFYCAHTLTHTHTHTHTHITEDSF